MRCAARLVIRFSVAIPKKYRSFSVRLYILPTKAASEQTGNDEYTAHFGTALNDPETWLPLLAFVLGKCSINS